MALDQDYYQLWFESFQIDSTAGHRDPVQLLEIQDECDNRSVDPYSLLTECSKKLFYDYPVGTKFFLKSKLTDREGKGLFFYTSFQWSPLKIEKPNK